MEVKAKIGKDGSPIVVDYKPLDATTVGDLAKNFGDDVVIAHAKSSITVALQSFLRGLIKANKSQAEAQAAVSEWKPGIRTPGKSRSEKAEDLIGKMNDAEKKELLKKLKAA